MRASSAIAQHRSCAMRSVALVVHGVVVVVVNIVAVIRELGAPVPEVVGHVEVVVVDTRIDNGHHNAFAREAHLPHLGGTHLDDILRDFARGRCRLGLFAIRKPVAFNGIANHLDIITLRQILDSCLVGIQTQCVGHPKDGRLGRHAVALHLGKRMTQVVLRGSSELFQLVDDEFAAFGTRHKIIGAAVELRAVVVRLHDDDDADLLIITTASHLFAQKRVDDILGKTSEAEESQKDSKQ